MHNFRIYLFRLMCGGSNTSSRTLTLTSKDERTNCTTKFLARRLGFLEYTNIPVCTSQLIWWADRYKKHLYKNHRLTNFETSQQELYLNHRLTNFESSQQQYDLNLHEYNLNWKWAQQYRLTMYDCSRWAVYFVWSAIYNVYAKIMITNYESSGSIFVLYLFWPGWITHGVNYT